MEGVLKEDKMWAEETEQGDSNIRRGKRNSENKGTKRR